MEGTLRRAWRAPCVEHGGHPVWCFSRTSHSKRASHHAVCLTRAESKRGKSGGVERSRAGCKTGKSGAAEQEQAPSRAPVKTVQCRVQGACWWAWWHGMGPAGGYPRAVMLRTHKCLRTVAFQGQLNDWACCEDPCAVGLSRCWLAHVQALRGSECQVRVNSCAEGAVPFDVRGPLDRSRSSMI